jgi:EAL domain-containing protein (putative c-di-GMP-specific phosphodiesterase class I)
VKLAIDDFGTGYCSLAYLQQFPVDAIKIDQSFVASMEDSPEGASLVHTIVQLGRDLGLDTVAEGIETASQLQHLQNEHCVAGQGYLLGRPLGVEAVSALLADARRNRSLTPA